MDNGKDANLKIEDDTQDCDYEYINKKKYIAISIMVIVLVVLITFLGIKLINNRTAPAMNDSMDISQLSNFIGNMRTEDEVSVTDAKLKETSDKVELANIVTSEVLEGVILVFDNKEYKLEATASTNTEGIIISKHSDKDSVGESINLMELSENSVKEMTSSDIVLNSILSAVVENFTSKNPDVVIKSIGNAPNSKSFAGLYTEKGGSLVSAYRAEVKDGKIYFDEVKSEVK